METPHLYNNQYLKTQSYLSYFIAVYVFQIKSSLIWKTEITPLLLFWNSLSVFLICYDAKQKIYTKEDVISNLLLIKIQNKNHFKEIQ